MSDLSILFIDHSYHRKTRSTEFLIDLLRGMGTVDVQWDDSWLRGEKPVSYRSRVANYDIVVVLQMHQVIAELAPTRHRNLIFVPMYDGAHDLPKKFWAALTGVKILCFSAALHEICTRHRLQSELVRYYPERHPDIPPPVDGRRLFIWHRRRTPSWSDIASLIPGSQFDRVHLHQVTDPGFESAARPTAWEVANIDLTESVWFDTKGELDALLNQFNYYLAPRDREGIGQSFIDAMAKGLVILSLDFPTANEYIVDGVNGYLLRSGRERFDLPGTPDLRDASLHYMHKGRAIYDNRRAGLLSFLGAAGPRRRLPWISQWMDDLRAQFKPALEPRRSPRIGAGIPTVSVIVIGHDDAAARSRSINSVLRQKLADFELVVVDRASRAAKADQAAADHWLSEPGTDVCSATTKAIRSASGGYLVILNAGDEFFGDSAISDALQDVPQWADVVYGHHFSESGRSGQRVQLVADMRATYAKLIEGHLSQDWLSGIPVGSSIFMRSLLLKHIDLDARYPLATNHQLLFAMAKAGARFYHTTTFVSKRVDPCTSKQDIEQRTSDRRSVALRFTQNAARVDTFYDQERERMSRRQRRRHKSRHSLQSSS